LQSQEGVWGEAPRQVAGVPAPDRDEGAVLSAFRLIFKSYAFEPPNFFPLPLGGRQARMPESERPKCGTDAAPQSVHKGLGDGVIKLALSI